LIDYLFAIILRSSLVWKRHKKPPIISQHVLRRTDSETFVHD